MLTLKDINAFREFLESGGWADAFAHAGEELRGEMIEKVEALLETADAADKVVGQVLFGPKSTPAGNGPIQPRGGVRIVRRTGIIVALVVLVGAAFWGTWTLLNSPHYALYQIGKAIHQREPRLFLAYVDIDQILRSQKQAIIDEMIPDRSKTDGRNLAENLLSVFMGPVIDMVKDRVARLVADPKRENLPSSWALVAAAEVDWNGDYAMVVLADPEKDRRLRMGMRRDPSERLWKVVELDSADVKRLLREYLKGEFPGREEKPQTKVKGAVPTTMPAPAKESIK